MQTLTLLTKGLICTIIKEKLMKEITVREIIRETQKAVDRGQTYSDVEKCTQLLNRLKQLEKRIEDVNSFVGGEGGIEFGHGIAFALKKILGKK